MQGEKEIIIDEEFKNLIPPLETEEYNGLKESILNEGCRDPLVLWDNILLDGHNRYRICMENDIIFKRVEKNFDDREQAKIWILENQLGRRNLNDAQRIDIVDKLFGFTEKHNAEKRKLSTLKKGDKVPDTQNFVERGETNKKLGNKAKVSKETFRKGKEIKTKQPEIWDKCLTGELSIDKAYKETKQQKKQQERKEQSEQGKNIIIDDDAIDFRLGDFTKVLDDIPNNSIDLILTDPPYPVEFIEEWDKLGQFAKEKLKPNGFLVAYCGHKNLFESMIRLNEYLDFYWIFSLVHSGNTKLIKFNNIEAGWKPILVYQNGYKKIENRVKDIIIGTGREKNNHKWQQALDELNILLDGFSKPGDTVCDPFAGSGTTLIAIKQNNRVAFGAEKDEDEYNIAKGRINDDL